MFRTCSAPNHWDNDMTCGMAQAYGEDSMGYGSHIDSGGVIVLRKCEEHPWGVQLVMGISRMVGWFLLGNIPSRN